MSVFISILVKNKQYVLPLFLHCLYNLDYPRNQIALYIRSNNNTDQTIPVLQDWLQQHQSEYKQVITDYSDVSQKVERFKEHEWNAERFSVLAKIRQTSLDVCYQLGYAYYFVIDCDNFIIPNTLKQLIQTNCDVIGPFLKSLDPEMPRYANFHHCIDANGYFLECPHYEPIFTQETTGLIPVKVIHCTYLIKREVLPKLKYIDGSSDYEYVIFARSCRNNYIQQYLDNRQLYGSLTFLGFDFPESVYRDYMNTLSLIPPVNTSNIVEFKEEEIKPKYLILIISLVLIIILLTLLTWVFVQR